jgi:hypothetical protein
MSQIWSRSANKWIIICVTHDTRAWSQYHKHSLMMAVNCRNIQEEKSCVYTLYALYVQLAGFYNNKCLGSIYLHSIIDLMHTHNFCLHGYHEDNTINIRVYWVTQYVPSNWVSPAAAPVLLSGGLGMLGCLLHLCLNDVAPGWYAAPEQDSQVLIYYWEYITSFTELKCPKMWRTKNADSTFRCHCFCSISLPSIVQ